MAKNTNNETAKKRYVVAPGNSFVGNKKVYGPGDEIDESAFKKPEYFQRFLKCDPPKIVEAPPKKEDEKTDSINETENNPITEAS